MPCKAVRQKRMLIGHRQSLVDRLTQVKNSIRAILCTMAIDWPAGKNGWTQKRLNELAEHARPLDAIADACDFWRGQLYTELQLYTAVKQQLDNVTFKLDAVQKEQSAVTLLQTVPGVGPRTAEALVAVIDDPHRFKNCRQVGTYVGFTPRQYETTQDRDCGGRPAYPDAVLGDAAG